MRIPDISSSPQPSPSRRWHFELSAPDISTLLEGTAREVLRSEGEWKGKKKWDNAVSVAMATLIGRVPFNALYTRKAGNGLQKERL